MFSILYLTFFLCHSCGKEIIPSSLSVKFSSPDLEKLTLWPDKKKKICSLELTWEIFFLCSFSRVFFWAIIFRGTGGYVRVRAYTNCSAQTALIQHSSYWKNCATWMTDLSMKSLFVMGNGSAVNEHIRKEQELSKPNLTSIKLNYLLR